ncbi:MAG: hypothetical protein Q8R18_00535 [bacterium]|nr:hypothetical protein [bacterium]
MGLKAILTSLEREGITDIDLSMGEESIAKSYQVTFQFSFEKGTLHDPISIPQNISYQITEHERIPYRKIWENISKICPPHPLIYLGPNLTEDYTKNIPNALHLISGWLLKRRKLESIIKERKLNIQINKIGEYSYNPELLDLIENISVECYPELYRSYITKDAEVF